ncbi:MAG: S-layer homology domain-containing protein [Candidatus Limnocylindria bacterium]
MIERRRLRMVVAVVALAGLLGALVAPVQPVRAASTPFTDIGSSMFKGDIEWLYAEGITGGCTATRYCPDAKVSREQMASFLARMFDLPSTATDYFIDDEASIHEGSINRLAAAGITGGCTTTFFCPRSPVTRAQMASFIARAAKLTVGADRNYFNDDNSDLHEANIDRSAAAGITGGCGQWRYCPSGSVTRGQMAAFLHRIVNPVSPPPYPAPDTELTLAQLLARLSTAAENRTGYDRALFRHWIDADGDGCNTRYEVLIAEATTRPSVGAGCSLSGGSWLSLYDGLTFSDPGGLDVDHMVPLAEAWDSGAYSWTAARREAFANDLGVGWSLIAVSASTNRSKGDRDPAEWLPPRAAYRCTYLGDWLAVKVRWSLRVDSTERSAIQGLIGNCSSTRRPVEIAP